MTYPDVLPNQNPKEQPENGMVLHTTSELTEKPLNPLDLTNFLAIATTKRKRKATKFTKNYCFQQNKDSVYLENDD